MSSEVYYKKQNYENTRLRGITQPLD